ncbi:MAG: TldD/PmbA family protein [Myxococcaceae bacterium]
MKELQQAVEQSLALAKKAGASAVGASVTRMRESEVTWRDGKVENMQEAITRGLTLQLYVDGRYSAGSTSDLRPQALAKFVDDSVKLTRALAPDPHRALPGAALYANRAKVDLSIADNQELTADQRLEIAQAIEEAARAVHGSDKFNSVTTGIGDTRIEMFRAHSDGFEGAQSSTFYSADAQVSVTDSDGRRPEGYARHARRHFNDLPNAAELGREAAERTLSRLGAHKAPSALLPAIVENRVAGTLVNHLLSPLTAQALQQKRSCFDGKLGHIIGSARLSFQDDPLLTKGLSSRLFDGEGMTAKRLRVFENGVLHTYYVDNYYGRKLGMAQTTARPSNLEWKLGSKAMESLISQMKDGLLITAFLGGNSNATSGDFSLGVEGFRVRNGKRAEVVSEMNLAGNHLTFWKKLVEVGNDPWASSGLRTPTLVFEPVQFAGA